jgi:hypothetical protein
MSDQQLPAGWYWNSDHAQVYCRHGMGWGKCSACAVADASDHRSTRSGPLEAQQLPAGWHWNSDHARVYCRHGMGWGKCSAVPSPARATNGPPGRDHSGQVTVRRRALQFQETRRRSSQIALASPSVGVHRPSSLRWSSCGLLGASWVPRQEMTQATLVISAATPPSASETMRVGIHPRQRMTATDSSRTARMGWN